MGIDLLVFIVGVFFLSHGKYALGLTLMVLALIMFADESDDDDS